MATLREQLESLLQEPFVTKDERENIRARLPSFSDEEFSNVVSQLEEDKQFAAELRAISAMSAVPVQPLFTLADIERATENEFLDPAMTEKIVELAHTLMWEHSIRELRTLLKTLQIHAEQSPELLRNVKVGTRYAALFVEMNGKLFAELNEQDRLTFLRKNLRPFFSSQYVDAGRVFDAYFATKGEENISGEQHQLFIRSLRENEETIGTHPLVIPEREGTSPPTIKNWIIDYLQFTSLKRMRENIDIVRYLSEGKNVQHLSSDDKNFLRKTIQFFDYLAFARYEQFTTFDDPLEQDRFLKAKKELSTFISSRRPVTIVASPSPVSLHNAERHVDTVSIKGRLRANGKDVTTILYDFIAPPQGTRATTSDELVAVLTILSEDNMLEKAMSAPQIHPLFTVYLKSRNAPDLLEGFRLTPTMPKFMILFLRWVLEEKAKLSEHDAARVGATLANVLKKRGNGKYMRIAYFDAATNAFQWS